MIEEGKFKINNNYKKKKRVLYFSIIYVNKILCIIQLF